MATALGGFGSRWRTVRGLRLHALVPDGGRGTPAVLLPGLVTASRSMVPLARALASRGLRVYILDPPGFGYSDKPQRTLTVGEQAALIAEWLAAEPIEQALPRVGAPALVIRADRDRLSSLQWAERLARLAPAGELARLPGLGHDAFYQAPGTVAAVAAPFLTAAAV